MAKVVSLPDGYSIDATEVTASQYKNWVATQPSTTGLPAVCSWKTSYRPGYGMGNRPVAMVDWCDAYGYCAAVGKRLCGKVGGGSNGYMDYANASLSQWYNACSAKGQNAYPYGNNYEGQKCNGADKGNSAVDVSSLQECQSSTSGYTGLYDMSGNALEWEDSCMTEAGASDMCRVRGGSFQDDSEHLRCDYGASYYGAYRDHTYTYLGFRCCSSP